MPLPLPSTQASSLIPCSGSPGLAVELEGFSARVSRAIGAALKLRGHRVTQAAAQVRVVPRHYGKGTDEGSLKRIELSGDDPLARENLGAMLDALDGWATESMDAAPVRRVYGPHPVESLRAVQELLGFALTRQVPPSVRARMGTAVHEVLANCFEHAPDCGFSITVHTEERRWVVEVTDEGPGFELSLSPATADRDGLTRVAALCDGLEIDTQPGCGTTVHMAFGIYRVDWNEVDHVDLSDQDCLTPALARRLTSMVRDPDAAAEITLSPALAVVLGRLLQGPAPMDQLRASLGDSLREQHCPSDADAGGSRG